MVYVIWELMQSLKSRDTSTVIVRHPQSYGSIEKPASVFVSNGSGWRGEKMSFEKQQSELILLNQIRKDELAKVVVELIKDSRELPRAIMEVVWNCPNIVTQV
jgi:hypothetical protein